MMIRIGTNEKFMLEYCIICRYSRTVGLPYQYCGIPHAIDEFLTFLTVTLRPLLTVDPNQNPKTYFWIVFFLKLDHKLDHPLPPCCNKNDENFWLRPHIDPSVCTLLSCHFSLATVCLFLCFIAGDK